MSEPEISQEAARAMRDALRETDRLMTEVIAVLEQKGRPTVRTLNTAVAAAAEARSAARAALLKATAP